MLLARCYANFYWLFKEGFGFENPPQWLNFVQMFGFFVAMAFLTAAVFLYGELKRREKLGWMKPYQTEITVGESVKPMELLLNFLLGFVLGFKLIGLILDYQAAIANPQMWIASAKGSLVGGIIGGLLFAAQKWYEKNSQKLDTPRKEILTLWPHDMIGDIVLMAAIGGISGAKIFYLFESPGNFSAFLNDPMGSFFGGLTIFGGVVGGTFTVLLYAYFRKVNLLQMCDAASPTLLIALAVGRIGCQSAGDGDWGIPSNLAAKPSWLPDWLWAYDYSHNVNNEGSGVIQGCQEAYCHYVTPLVYPTPIYEIVMLTALFILLWGVRKRIHAPGAIFSLYFLLSGIERLLSEHIRVNTKLHFLGIQATQAEIIAVVFIIMGVVGWFASNSAYKKKLKSTSAQPVHIETEE